MPKIVITHDVVDIDRWLRGKSERAEAIGAVGRNVQDYVAMDGSNRIAITAEVDDLDAIRSMLTSPSDELQETMERHGVRPPLDVFIER